MYPRTFLFCSLTNHRDKLTFVHVDINREPKQRQQFVFFDSGFLFLIYYCGHMVYQNLIQVCGPPPSPQKAKHYRTKFTNI